MRLRKILLFFISLLPISSVSFAMTYDDALGDRHSEEYYDLEGEMIRRIQNGNISDEYYDFLDKNQIEDMSDLMSAARNRHRSRMLTKFKSDVEGVETVAGALSEIITD